MPGGMLSLSSNGKNPDTGIVWALAPVDGDANHDVVDGIARAYDATNLDPTPIDPQTPRLKLLWDSTRSGVTFKHAKFNPPVVADGRSLCPPMTAALTCICSLLELIVGCPARETRPSRSDVGEYDREAGNLFPSWQEIRP